MELWKELFCNILRSEDVKIRFPQIPDIAKLMELECYKALNQIKEILENEDLEDKECFIRIEEAICLFEKMGIDIGSRHDFYGL